MPNLNTDILSNVPVSFPPLVMQKKAIEILQSLDSKIAVNNSINDNLQQMAYDTYMHLLFKKHPNGKLGEIIVENDKSSVQVG